MKAYLPFSDAFIKNKGKPLLYRGKLLYVSLRVDLACESVLRIDVLRHQASPEQVIEIVAQRCMLANQDSKTGKSRSIAIYVSEWSQPICLSVVDVVPGARIFIGNATASTIRGPIWSGMGNYALQIESKAENEYLCRCSQGMWPSKPDFNALVFTVRVEKAKNGNDVSRAD